MASFKMTQGISRVPEDVFVEDGMTVTSGGLTVTAGGVTVTAGTTTLGGSLVRDLVTLTADTTITQANHAGRILLMGEVGGDASATFTLPAATGAGDEYKFIVSVVNTSNYVIKVADATDTIDSHEYVVTVKPNEFNHSMNYSLRCWPTGSIARSEVNWLRNPYMCSEFTGSNFNTYVTTIALYNKDDYKEPVIIAKLPRAIMKSKKIAQTFIIKADINL